MPRTGLLWAMSFLCGRPAEQIRTKDTSDKKELHHDLFSGPSVGLETAWGVFRCQYKDRTH